MARLLTVGLALLGLVGAVFAATPDDAVAERPWIEVTSPNFRIYSVLDEKRTIELLRHLEIMRATLGDATEESTYESGVPTIILAVDDHRDYVSIGAPDYSGGYFFSDLRENAILIEDSDETAGIQVILHEYAHYLNRQVSHMRFPRWFEEGNAEYVSHSEMHDGAFEYGLAPPQYLATLGFGTWMPLATLLEISDASALTELDGAMFYAQSWLLVHYLYSRAESDAQLTRALTRYARHSGHGLPSVEAFERAFGLDVAEQWFESVLSDKDLRALAEAGLGRIAGYRGEVQAANARFESAIKLMAWDFTIWMDYAQYWAQRVASSYDPEERVQNASKLIGALESALTISEATPELNSLMGFAYLAKGRDPLEAIEYLEAAAAEAPHDQASRLLLANAYLYVGRLDDAVRVAEAVLLFEHEPGLISGAARDVIAEAREMQAN